jgi:hypothetical protein
MDKKSQGDKESKKDKKDKYKKHHHHHHHHDKDKDKDKDKESQKDKEKDKEKSSTDLSKFNFRDKGGDGKVRQIKLSDYEMGKTLGPGSFGTVKIAKNKKTGEYVAI